MKRIISIIMALGMGIMCASCGGKTAQTTADNDGKIKVYCSFYAMSSFAQQIVGDKAEIHTLVPVGTEPHEWEPSVSDIKNISDGDVFVYHGADMEEWVDTVTSQLAKTDCKIVAVSDGIEEKGNDPHMWLDPKNAEKEVTAIYNALSEKDPENAEYYLNNYNTFMSDCNSLYDEYAEAAAGFANKKVVVSHEAYGYLCSEFGLEQVAVTGVHSEGEPSPARLAEISDMMKNENIHAVYSESMEDTSVINTLAKSANAQVLELNPFEGDVENRDYCTVMRSNLENLKKGLD